MRLKYIVACVFFVHLLITDGFADTHKEKIVISIFPCTDVVSSFKKFHPLVTYLKKETLLNIGLIIPQNYQSYKTAVKKGKIDFALQDPHILVQLSYYYDNNNFLQTLTMEGNIVQTGVVIARKDRNIKKICDLNGKTVMFGPELSTARWAVAKLLFTQSGININKDLKAYSNGGCCEDIAFNVSLKAVDAGVVCDHFLQKHSGKQRELGVNAKQLTVIAKTKSVPTRVFCAAKTARSNIIAAVNQALLRLDINRPEHKKILNKAELSGFQKAGKQDFINIKRILGRIVIE